MNYLYKVSLPGIKGFARVYRINGKASLYHLHKQMLSDMSFPVDQIVLFKAFDKNGSLVARYATIDIGSGSIETIRIASQVADEVVSYEYFYDTTNKKSVIVTFMGETPDSVELVDLIESKGPNPEAFLNGFVAFEDLPPEKRLAPENADPDDEEDDEEGGKPDDDIFEDEEEGEEENLYRSDD